MAFLGTTGNSQFSTLTWTSKTKLTDRYDSLTGTVFSDQAGNVNVDQSLDGVNWDITDTTAVTASTGTKINVTVLCPYIRVRFVATTTQPTTFRLGTRLGAAGDS